MYWNYQRKWRINVMKKMMIAKLQIAAFLLSLAGTGAVRAAEPIWDAQQSARSLLSSERFPSRAARALPVAASASASPLVAADGQEQARRMVLGRSPEAAHLPSSVTMAVPRDREVSADPADLARRMISGQAGPSHIRLTSAGRKD
jgi:hypothetical protein